MSAALSVALAFSGVLMAPSGSPDAPSPEQNAAIVLITEYGFRAVNPTHEDRVLVLGDANRGWIAISALPAGADVFHALHPGLTRDLVLEVVTLGAHGVERTGPVPIDLSVMTGGAPLLVVASRNHVHGFALSAAKASGELMKTAVWPPMGATGSTATSTLTAGKSSGTSSVNACNHAAAFAHVPVVTIDEKEGGSRPPRLDDDPLSVF